MATSSTVARWELAHRIKVRRNELGISVDQIAMHLGFTRNFFSAVENQRSMLAFDKLDTLLQMLEFDDAERAELTDLDKAARQRGWWETKDTVDLVGEDSAKLFGLEQGAVSVRLFESLSIPGLLQERDYARAMIGADPYYGQAHVDQLTEIRLKRQQRIRSGDLPVTVLLSEAAIRQKWTDSETHVRQLNCLVEASKKSNIAVQIIPFDRPIGSIAGSSTMVLMRFDSPRLPAVAYQESIRDLGILEQRDPQYERLRVAWEDGRDRAHTAEESCALINTIISQL